MACEGSGQDACLEVLSLCSREANWWVCYVVKAVVSRVVEEACVARMILTL